MQVLLFQTRQVFNAGNLPGIDRSSRRRRIPELAVWFLRKNLRQF